MAAFYFPAPSSTFLSSSYYCHINAPSSSSYLLHLHLRPFQFCSIVCSATVRKSSRKLISDADLCKNLLDFVSSIGMPAGYVPSTKELTEHGRKDLANIVRRRGYKFIKELLANSIGVANEPNLKESLTEGKIGIAEQEDTADEKVEDMPHEALDGSFLKEASILVNKTASTIEPAASLEYQVCMPVESSTVSSSLKSKDIFDERVDGSPVMEDPASDNEFVPAVSLEGGGISVESTVSLSLQVKDISDEAAGASFIEGAYIAESDSVSMHEDDQQCAGVDPSAFSSSLQGNDLSDETIAGLSFTTKDDSLKGPELGATVDDQHHVPVEHSIAGSLQEKVSEFMKYGKLDEIEDNLSRKVNGVADSGIYRHIDSSMGTESMVHGEGNLPHVGGGNDNIVMSRSVRTSSLTALPVVDNGFMRSNHSLAVGTKETKFEEDLNAESNKIESQVEVERLRVMLHQKELELSQLKEQIEKEKQTLSFLQAKTEAEINKAQKLILEKDAELYAAEESLSGLKEVQIQYFVEGKIVELAGSFNGWHQRIILDPQPSSDITDPVCSSFEKYISESKLTSFGKTVSLDEHVGQRDWGTGFAKKERDKKSRLWSTSLWLYPGVYEIKFIVDGEWTLDPQREITSRGGIQNNILRIER